jgi:hypothetical protein
VAAADNRMTVSVVVLAWVLTAPGTELGRREGGRYGRDSRLLKCGTFKTSKTPGFTFRSRFCSKADP